MRFIRETFQFAALFAIGYPLACLRYGPQQARQEIADEVARILRC